MESYDRKRVALRLKSLRTDKGWGQEELAEKSGVPLNTLRSVETARSGMNLSTAYKLTGALGCTLDTLVCRDEGVFAKA